MKQKRHLLWISGRSLVLLTVLAVVVPAGCGEAPAPRPPNADQPAEKVEAGQGEGTSFRKVRQLPGR